MFKCGEVKHTMTYIINGCDSWGPPTFFFKISWEISQIVFVLFTFNSLFLLLRKCKKGLMATANAFLQGLMEF